MLALAIEHRRVRWIDGDDHRIDDVGAGHIEPPAGAQAVGLGLQHPTDIRRCGTPAASAKAGHFVFRGSSY